MDDVLTHAMTRLSPPVDRLSGSAAEQTMLLTMLLGRPELNAEAGGSCAVVRATNAVRAVRPD
jgi:hypothetical protein